MTQKIKLKPTDRLYHNKYPYKIDFNLVGASLIRNKGLDWAKEFTENQSIKLPFWLQNNDKVDRPALKLFLNVMEPYLLKAEAFQTRTEGDFFTYYSKDLTEIETLANELVWCCTDAWGPQDSAELDFLIDNKRKRLCDNIPYNKYKFKVILKSNIPITTREQFLDWADNYTEDDIKISKGTSRWLSSQRNYCQLPFFYIADSKMLTFTSIFLSNSISVIHEYIPRHTVI